MDEDTEYLKLPLEERMVHKLWKARVSGYEDAKKLFGQWDEEDPNWKKFQGLAKKMVTDSNAVAQEKGLEACLLFVENCKTSPKTAGEVVDGLVNKCVAAPKTRTKELASQICLMYCEVEAFEKVIEQLLAGLSQKNPKVVSGCVAIVTNCLAAFGAKVIKVSPLLKAILPLLDHRDKEVRDQGKRLIIESYRWIGEVMKSQLTGLKPVQLTELETEFGALEGVGRVKPERWLRSAGPPRPEKGEAAGGAAGEEDDEEEEDSRDSNLDPYELLDPVDILSKMPKNFFEQIEEKKWQLRKESLDALLPLTQNPKLLPGDYHELVKALRKVIAKDTNVMLVAQAAQCLTGLAKGLRNHFKQLASNSFSTLLEKFKEKKMNVVTVLRECTDAFYPILGIEAIQEECLAALKHKTPSVKAETASYLARCFARCPPLLTTNKKMTKGYVSALLETLSESDPGVREASAEALGTLFKFLGEAKVMPFMPDLDNLKLEKIKEKAEKVELMGKSAAPKPSKPQPAAAPVSGPRVVKPASAPSSGPGAAAARPTGSAPASGPKKVVKSGGANAAAGGGKKPAAGKSGSPPTALSGGIASESDISLEECEARCEEVFSASIMAGLGDANWKVRLAAMEEAKSRLEAAGSGIPGLIAVKLLCKKPGLKDNNFQVLGHKISALAVVAKNSTWSQQCWDAVNPDIVEKLADKKNVEACKETLYCMAESASFNFVFAAVLDAAFSQKSPVVKAEALSWAAEGIKMFGFGGLQPRPALECIKKGLADTNPAVRTSAVGLLGVIHWYMGATARRMFEDEKPAILQQIDAECDKYKGQALPIPARGVKARSPGAESQEADTEEPEAAMEDLVPRQNIAGQLNEDLCQMIQDKNWKIRKEGLDKLKDIVSSAKFITNDLGSLPAALGPRTTDTNKNLAVQALEMVGDLVLAMGVHSRVQVPHLLPPVLAALADSKPNVRQAAVTVINTFLKETSLRDLLVSEIFFSALSKGNPFVKQEIFQWLAISLPDGKGVNKEELILCLPVLYAAVEDRSAEVRKAAQEAVGGFMKHLGYEAMRKATDKLSAVSKTTLMPLLDKARAALPPPPTKPAAVKPASANANNNRLVREDSSESRGSSSSGQKPLADKAPPSARPGMAAGQKGVVRPGAKVSSAGGVAVKKPGGSSGADDMDSSPLYAANKLKNNRFRDEAKLKVLKWNFATPRQEFVDQLKEQMLAANFNKSLVGMMFHADFKQHLRALDLLIPFAEADMEALVANLDLLLKWMTLRFFETNPSVNIKGLEYLALVFQLLAEQGDVTIHDIEASSFIPFLVIKIGDPKDQIRNSCRTILRHLCKLYPASKLFVFLMNGLATKNAKQRAECLEEMGSLIRVSGLGVCGAQPALALRELAKQIADRDNAVRSAALNAVTEAYFQEGERLYKMIGNLPEKDMAMLEERIKRSAKTRTVAPVMQQTEPAPAPESVAAAAPSNRNAKSSGLRPPSAPSAGLAREGESDLRMRYQHNRAGIAGPRPASGAFTLDLEKIEAVANDLVPDSGPELVEHDLEGIINSSPVLLPVIRTGVHHRVLSPDHNTNTRLQHNQEAQQAVNNVIAQIFSTDSNVCMTALLELDQLIKNNERVEVLGPCVDHLFSMSSMQYRYVLQTKMKSEDVNEKDCLRLFQHLSMVLMGIYGHRDIVRRASTQVLHDLIHIIVLVLLEPGVASLPEGGQLIRALNVLTVKIVERSDHTAVSLALLRLLQECVGGVGSSSTLARSCCQLVMKCLWKLIRALPTWLQEGLDVAAVLLALHDFLKTFPSSYWKGQEEDTPMRTVKTVIHTLVKLMGEPILSYTTRISDPGASELVPYIKKLINTGVGQDAGGGGGGGSNLPVRPDSAKKKAPRFSKSDHEALADIFKKIGQKELTKVGLQDLYNFKQENPHADLEPFLAKSSDYFRQYIERGLRTIEMEVKSGMAAPAPSSGSRSSSILSDSNSTAQPLHLVYRERLKTLRASAGLESRDQENCENYSSDVRSGYSSGRGLSATSSTALASRYQPATDTPQIRQEEMKSEPQQPQPPSNLPNVEDIKRRLAKIKQAY